MTESTPDDTPGASTESRGRPPIPVTVLTGFLGAGKTTLLNRLLAGPHGLEIAVIENELGTINIDSELVAQRARSGDVDVIELDNGCLCCNYRGDLSTALATLSRRRPTLDRIVIETSGVANPAPVVQTFYLDQDLYDVVTLDAVVTVVDAANVGRHLGQSPEVGAQLGFADLLVLNKIDLVDSTTLSALESELRRVNRSAEIVRTRHCELDVETVLGAAGFDPASVAERLSVGAPGPRSERALRGKTSSSASGGPTTADRTVSGTRTPGETVEHDHDECPPDCEHPSHALHRTGVTSFAIVDGRPVDVDSLNEWLGAVLAEQGEHIYRMKGILHLANDPRRYVFQGVHMTFECVEGDEWGDVEPANRMVFIGRGIDIDWVRAGFERCLVGG